MSNDYVIFTYIDEEINSMTELIEILDSGAILNKEDEENTDLLIMKNKLKALVDAKRMILKASLEIPNVDNTFLMSVAEKKMFLKVVKFLMFFRRKK